MTNTLSAQSSPISVKIRTGKVYQVCNIQSASTTRATTCLTTNDILRYQYNRCHEEMKIHDSVTKCVAYLPFLAVFNPRRVLQTVTQIVLVQTYQHIT
jgi:hypothetical protein